MTLTGLSPLLHPRRPATVACRSHGKHELLWQQQQRGFDYQDAAAQGRGVYSTGTALTGYAGEAMVSQDASSHQPRSAARNRPARRQYSTLRRW